ncbi:MAG: hypothetical protein E4H40_01020, partial [Candidatus Brocadiia bacterium]
MKTKTVSAILFIGVIIISIFVYWGCSLSKRYSGLEKPGSQPPIATKEISKHFSSVSEQRKDVYLYSTNAEVAEKFSEGPMQALNGSPY